MNIKGARILISGGSGSWGQELTRQLLPMDPEKMAGSKTRIYDDKSLKTIVKQVITENTNTVLDYKSGKKEAFHFLVGQVMRKTEGRGDPETIRKLLRKLLTV